VALKRLDGKLENFSIIASETSPATRQPCVYYVRSREHQKLADPKMASDRIGPEMADAVLFVWLLLPEANLENGLLLRSENGVLITSNLYGR